MYKNNSLCQNKNRQLGILCLYLQSLSPPIFVISILPPGMLKSIQEAKVRAVSKINLQVWGLDLLSFQRQGQQQAAKKSSFRDYNCAPPKSLKLKGLISLFETKK